MTHSETDNITVLKIQLLYGGLNNVVILAKKMDNKLVADIVSYHVELMEKFFSFLKENNNGKSN